MRPSTYLMSIGIAAALCACGGASKRNVGQPVVQAAIVTDPGTVAARGALLDGLSKKRSLTLASYQDLIQEFGPLGEYVQTVAGPARCGIDVYYYRYATVGAANEAATATGAIMVPSGAECSGARPVLMYGHGSTRRRDANMADIRPNTVLGNTALFAATMFAAQGYIVIAPNYAGYDTSSLGYHPHHIADQQSKDMIDALAAARKAFPGMSASENGKLFITGYSEGGYVAMATHRAMQAAGMTVTASAPMAGNYAESVGYERLIGSAGTMDDLSGVTTDDLAKWTMTFTGWQKAYGDIYAAPVELYPAAYAAKMETLTPHTLRNSELSAALPPFLLANDMPHYARLSAAQQAYFGTPEQSLLKSSYLVRIQADIAAHPCPVTSIDAPLACSPVHPVRKAWLKNDLRTWVPASPMLMCGGARDPEVRHHNMVLTAAYFQAHGVKPGLVSALDVDSPIGADDPYTNAKNTFQTIFRNTALRSADPLSRDNYHGDSVFVACNMAARTFFKTLAD